MSEPADRVSRKTYVLVHGAFHGGWCWRDVAQDLRARGHDVYCPTLTGLGERSHLLAAKPTLETFIEDVAQVIKYEGLSHVILVGHSFAGSVVSGLADRIPDKLRHLVYMDAQVLQSGESPAGGAPREHIERYEQRAIQTSNGRLLPPGEPSSFDVTDAKMADWVKARLTPHPFETYFNPLVLKHPIGNGIAATYVACMKPPRPVLAKTQEFARRQKGWTYVELPTGHNAMMTMPSELSDLLANVV